MPGLIEVFFVLKQKDALKYKLKQWVKFYPRINAQPALNNWPQPLFMRDVKLFTLPCNENEMYPRHMDVKM